MYVHRKLKKRIGSRILLLIPLLLPSIGGCTSDADKSADTKSIEKYRESVELKSLIEEGENDYLLVDVRTEEEYKGGFIPSAINIPLQIIEQNPPDVPKDLLVIVYCRSGNRSSSAKQILEGLGYTKVVNFGGIMDWSYEVETPGES